MPTANYWVNGQTGNDSNVGTFASPFATPAHGASVLTTGQTLAIAGQQSYRSEAIPTVVSTIVGWNGTPLIDASDPISTGAWSKTGGYTNIYQATVTVENAAGVGFICVWENNVCGPNFPYVSSLASLDTATNGYYVASQSAITGTSQTVYVNATGHGNPSSNGNVYEVNTRLQAVYCFAACTLSNVNTRRNLGNDGSLKTSQGSFVSNVKASDGTKHVALLTCGSAVNLTINNSYYAGQAKNQLVIFDNSPSGCDVTLTNLVTINTNETGGAVYGHANAGQFGTITLINPTLNAGTGGFGGVAAAAQVISGGSIADALTIEAPLNIVTGTTITGLVNVSGTTALSSCAISGTFVNGAIRNQFAGTVLSVSGCTISNSQEFYGGFYFDQAPASINIQNNAFLGASPQVNYMEGAGTTGIGSVAFDYNTYHYASGGTSYMTLNGVNYQFPTTGWAAWQALGYDLHGSRVTP